MNLIPYKRRANYYETDQMGIVHHTNYIRYFEEARIDFMRQIGCSCKELESKGAIIPVVDAYAKYLKSIKFDDEFFVFIKFDKFNGVKMEFSYEIRFSDTNQLASTGHTTHCFVDVNHKPFSIKKKLSDTYQKMISYLNYTPENAFQLATC